VRHLQRNDKRVVFVPAVSDSVDQPAERIIIVGLLKLDRIYSIDRGRKIAGVIVYDSPRAPGLGASYS
jgi:hypothetical protein